MALQKKLMDLPELVEQQVITPEVADRIIAYYEARQQRSPGRLGLLLAILGALLTGSGLILIIAHNWDDLSRSIKTIIAFTPLVIGQALCAYTLVKRPDSKRWRESAATFLFCAIGTTTATISQVYQISGELSTYLLTWLLLGALLPYLLRSSVVALLVIAGSTWYAVLTGYGDDPGSPWFYVLLVAGMIPHIIQVYKTQHAGLMIIWCNTFVGLSLAIVFGIPFREMDDFLVWFASGYLLLSTAYYYFARSRVFLERPAAAVPFLLLGLLGVLVILFLYSFRSAWIRADVNTTLISEPGFLASLIPLAISVFFMVVEFRGAGKIIFRPIGLAFLLFIPCVILLHDSPSLCAFVVNVWLLVIAVYYIRKGTREDHFGILNFGLGIVALLALCRFFDDDIAFLWRGVFFLLAGAGFIIANVLLLRKRKQIRES